MYYKNKIHPGKFFLNNLIMGFFGLITLFFLTACGSEKEAEEKMNFLIIMADDVSPELYGCYGNAEAKTPNIDKLAETGVLFNTCWAAPICSPTRAMILTGRYAHRTGWYHNAFRVSDGNGDFKIDNLTFAEVLKDQGYATAIGGKWQLPGIPDAPESGFNEYCIWEVNEGRLPEGSKFIGLKEDENTLARYWHPCMIRNGELMSTGPEDFGPDIATDFLIDFIKQNKENPFLAYYSMILPHGTRGQNRTTTPITGRVGDHINGSFQENVDYTDVLTGRLLKALDDLDLRKNTLVIFISDNGMPNKNTATNAGSRVPMLIDCPGIVQTRGKTEALVSLADILPTLVDFSGGRLPEGYEVDGKSLKSFLTGESDTHRDFLFNYLGTARMVRTRDWLLEAVDQVYNLPDGRLYDCRTDANNGVEVTGSKDPEILEARKMLEGILSNYPPIDTSLQSVKDIMQRYDGYTYRHKLVEGPQ